MKVIFLDIDGVLNNFVEHHLFVPIDPKGNRFETGLLKPAIELVNRLANENHAQIVISSSWREFDKSISKIQFDPDVKTFDLRDFLRRMGLTAKFHSDWHTPIPEFKKFSMASPRGKEIQSWLDKHPEVTSWVAIDDDRNFSQEQKAHCAFTNPNKGFTLADAHIANEILKKVNEVILKP